jgi:predicted RNase H-like nuclease
MLFIGLDLAWSPSNHTGAAVLRGCELIAHTGYLPSDTEILVFVAPYLAANEAAIVYGTVANGHILTPLPPDYVSNLSA